MTAAPYPPPAPSSPNGYPCAQHSGLGCATPPSIQVAPPQRRAEQCAQTTTCHGTTFDLNVTVPASAVPNRGTAQTGFDPLWWVVIVCALLIAGLGALIVGRVRSGDHVR